MSTPTIRPEVRELILQALKRQYLSESCHDAIQTGNAYQSIDLGDERTSGFRTHRMELLDQINFAGKRVLDLGSNLGEMSRAARARGAELVDGFEYDTYFIEIANLVNAHNGVSRVSFYQRDITNPAIFRDTYDVVFAFSVFIYLRAVVKELAAITREILVLETHRLDDNLHDVYLGPLSEYFPFHRSLGETEWGTSVDDKVKRAVIVFAKTEAALEAAFTQRRAGDQTPALVSSRWLQPAPGTQLSVDPKKTPWLDRFFSMWRFDSADAALAAASAIQLDVGKLATSYDLGTLALSGWTYWLLYLQGYAQFAQAKAVSDDNIYLTYLVKHFGPAGHDTGIASLLADREQARERVAARYRDFDAFRRCAAGDRSALREMAPLKIILRNPPTPDAKLVYPTGSDVPVRASLDGYHRLFLARLFRVAGLPAEVTSEP